MSDVNTKHTPGPWSYHWEDKTHEWAVVVDGLGNIVANVNTETGPDLPPLVSTKMPGENNARLIAAAPDLLEAAKHALAMPDGVAVSVWNTVRDELRAAIAKVTE